MGNLLICKVIILERIRVLAFSVKKNSGLLKRYLLYCRSRHLTKNCKDHLLTVSNTNFKIYGNQFNQLESSDSELYIRYNVQ